MNREQMMEVLSAKHTGILGIENRAENWKTARTFSPFLRRTVTGSPIDVSKQKEVTLWISRKMPPG
jgi:hypothetical protein